MLRKELEFGKMTPAQYMQLIGSYYRIQEEIDELQKDFNAQRDVYAAEAKARTNAAVVEITGDEKYADKAGAVNQAQEFIALETVAKYMQLGLETMLQTVALGALAEEVALELEEHKDDFYISMNNIVATEQGKEDASKGVGAAEMVMNGREQRAKELGDVNKPADYKSRDAWETQRQQELDAVATTLNDHLAAKLERGSSFLQQHSMFAARTDAAGVENDNNHEQDLRSSFSGGM